MTAFGDGTTEGDELGDGSAATETAPELSAKHSAAKERILTTSRVLIAGTASSSG
jgi:hypothetical protein